MPEGNANLEIGEHLAEHGSHAAESGGPHRRRDEMIEIIEAVLLAMVAIVTAWSGYQSAKWDGDSARLYSTSSRLRIEGDNYSVRSGQTLVYNAGAFNEWLSARALGQRKLETLMVKRFTPEYQVAFAAWLKTDPFTNPGAPAGPRFMPEYKDPLAAQADQLAAEAGKAFDEAVNARKTGESYVRLTVLLAVVLFLIALGQRFHFLGVRIAVICLAGVGLVYCATLVFTLPRA